MRSREIETLGPFSVIAEDTADDAVLPSAEASRCVDMSVLGDRGGETRYEERSRLKLGMVVGQE